MKEKDREKIALFRFKLISPILTGQVNSQKEYLAKIATETHNVPYYGPKEYVPKTIAMWLNDYRRGGFEALKPKRRSDRGKSRKVTPELKEIIMENRKEHPERSVSLFYDQLIAEKKIKPSDISYSTLLRFLKRENLMPDSPRSEGERKRFAHERVNALWQGDVLSGPYLTV
ncbi:helix-turn-helix domain-containing protein [Halarsenatibacter silvermanii]|uniref:Winged helix-turn helix n=1 Tax=Halarsenatibacter silvermanii TaxID=321763 RepID=A0A1G9U1B2_9FIRM|nr:helix-turn-helix domain-containing protein [Halarsenatibacter silvermanii]SDM53736.1 Winged helix-turn helix [Halarsenatibacter silvermanii]